MLLEFVILFVKDPETANLVVVHETFIQYSFSKLRDPQVTIIKYDYNENLDQDELEENAKSYMLPEPRLIKLSSQALGCIASLINKDNCT